MVYGDLNRFAKLIMKRIKQGQKGSNVAFSLRSLESNSCRNSSVPLQ